MSSLRVVGGKKLEGDVTLRGSKNAASKLMVASLLTDESCTITNVPFSVETDITRELCEQIGSAVVREGNHEMRIKTPMIKTSVVPELSRKNRIPILALGPLIHRNGFAEVPVLGGCPIGHRPINFHLEALNQMGITIERRAHSYYAEAASIHGAVISFPYPSVGATENVLLTAVLADGRTTIANAAVEPEIMNLIAMLRAMGATIAADTHARHIIIDGVKKLSGASVAVIPDRNEAVSFAAAALATDGDIFIRDITEDHLTAFLVALKRIGASHDIQKTGRIGLVGTHRFAGHNFFKHSINS